MRNALSCSLILTTCLAACSQSLSENEAKDLLISKYGNGAQWHEGVAWIDNRSVVNPVDMGNGNASGDMEDDLKAAGYIERGRFMRYDTDVLTT